MTNTETKYTIEVTDYFGKRYTSAARYDYTMAIEMVRHYRIECVNKGVPTAIIPGYGIAKSVKVVPVE